MGFEIWPVFSVKATASKAGTVSPFEIGIRNLPGPSSMLTVRSRLSKLAPALSCSRTRSASGLVFTRTCRTVRLSGA